MKKKFKISTYNSIVNFDDYEPLTWKQAILANCRQCCCYSYNEVKLCECKSCSLYQFKERFMKKNTSIEKSRNMTPEHLEKLRKGREAYKKKLSEIKNDNLPYNFKNI